MKELENKIKEKAFNRALEIAKEVQKVSGKDTNILQLELFMIAIALAGIGLVGIPETQKEKNTVQPYWIGERSYGFLGKIRKEINRSKYY